MASRSRWLELFFHDVTWEMIVNERATDRVRPTFRLSLPSLRRVHKIISRPTFARVEFAEGFRALTHLFGDLGEVNFRHSIVMLIPKSIQKKPKETNPRRIVRVDRVFVKIHSLAATAVFDLKKEKKKIKPLAG